MSVLLAIGRGALLAPLFGFSILLNILRFVGFIVLYVVVVIFSMALMLLAAPTVGRIDKTMTDPKSADCIWNIGTFWGFIFVLIAIFVAVMPLFSSPVEPTQFDGMHIFLIGLGVTNFLSLCYELGRKKAAKTDEVKAEPTDEKPDDGVSDFMTMYDSIRGFDSLAPEQTRELYRRIVELTGERKITPDEAKKLCAIVENGARAHIES